MEDLWPPDISQQTTEKSPASILKEQALLLSQKTNNLVTAEVIRKTMVKESKFGFNFILTSSTINYRYNLFSITHGVTLYPVEISSDNDLIKSIRPERGHYEWITVENETEYIRILKDIFSAENTRKVISTLIKMSDPDFI